MEKRKWNKFFTKNNVLLWNYWIEVFLSVSFINILFSEYNIWLPLREAIILQIQLLTWKDYPSNLIWLLRYSLAVIIVWNYLCYIFVVYFRTNGWRNIWSLPWTISLRVIIVEIFYYKNNRVFECNIVSKFKTIWWWNFCSNHWEVYMGSWSKINFTVETLLYWNSTLCQNF